MVWAVPCDCTVGDRTDRLLTKAHIPERYRDRDFENYDTDLPYDSSPAGELATWRQSLTQAKLCVQRFTEEFPIGSEHGLLLMGPAGVGKTHLAVAALKEIVLRGHSGLFYEYPALLKEIQDSYNPERQATEMSVLEPVVKTEILVLDDVGSSKPSHWALETVGYILGQRYNEHRVTIITTNYLDPEFARTPDMQNSSQIVSSNRRDRRTVDLTKSTIVNRLPSGELMASVREDSLEERVGKRIRSRLYEMCRTVEMTSPDYRKEVRHAGRFRG